MALLHPHAANFFLSGKRPVATGNPHPNLAPYDTFRTRTGEIFIGTGNDATFRKMCGLLGRPELADDARFRTNADRLENRAALSAEVQAIVAEEDGNALCTRLLAAGLPAGPVRYFDEVVAEPHTAARDMIAEIGWYRGLNTPIKFARTPGGAREAPPRFGAHGAELLLAHGFSAEEIAALKESGVVAERRRGAAPKPVQQPRAAE
jgi:formyl-CoA transferase